jgi:hypothetical protein
MTENDPLSVVFSEAEARAGTPLDALVMDHTRAALDAYYTILASFVEMEPVARGAVALIVPRVLQDAAAVRGAMRDDPAAPGLEDSYRFLLDELSGLATVFVMVSADVRQSPNHQTETQSPESDEHRAISAETEALMVASQMAKPAWAMLRQSRAVAYSNARPGTARGYRCSTDTSY